MKILIDMNLSPTWVETFEKEGWVARHWITIGSPDATDVELFEYALSNNFVLLTHDLDFGTILAHSHSAGPTVILLRGNSVFPGVIAEKVILNIRQYQKEIEAGCLMVFDLYRTRIRLLPL